MKNNYPYLKDNKFLTQIINLTNVDYYVKVIILNWDEQVVKELQGKVTTANISITGTSSVRRTGNITFVMEEEDSDAASLLHINKKIDLEIGYLNKTNQYLEYPIIWFPLGVYVVTGLSFNHNLSNITTSMELKDKMCLLNGECGGVIPAATVFDNYEVQQKDGSITTVHPTIYQIITELVNHFGNEQLGNIIVSDIDTRVKRVMEWTGSVPLFVLKSGVSSYYVTTDQADAVAKVQSGLYQQEQGSPFESGSNVGFTLTDFAYPGDLIGNAGDTVVTILDKIKTTLGNYEYFYDINGCFRFQEIKNYLNNAQSKYLLQSLSEGKLLPDYLSAGQAYLIQRNDPQIVFSFKQNKNLVTSYVNTPQINAIKNDYIAWGIRKSSSGQQYPIRYHLAIDDKPKPGHTYRVFEYTDQDETERWYAPLIYNTRASFPGYGLEGVFYYAEDTHNIYNWKQEEGLSDYRIVQGATLEEIKTADWRTELYFQGVAAQPYGLDSNYYYSELLAEWPKIYDIRNQRFKDEVIKDSSKMDFYLDLISPVTEHTQKICVGNIGRRTVIMNKDNNVNCVFEPYIPDLIFIYNDYADGSTTDMKKLRDECDEKGWTWIQVKEDIYDYLVPGVGLNSAYEEVRQNLYQYINYSQTITLQTLPIYFLEPNTCIEIEDKDSFIQGKYMINSLSFSLDVSSSLSVNASKMIERI